ncbi:methyltransferase domain-containing protein [Paenibacillus sp. 2TAB23]|uniref:methyltransferase domain-containing protein n=1 Tax=Paenibacillus sp. 2TAB23 TaxID=3233004 RepID=UPI003F997AD9
MTINWHTSDIALACPRCKGFIADCNDKLECASCNLQFEIVAGQPVMLDSGNVGFLKEEVKRTFSAINQSLEDKGLSRFATFNNWGFASLEQEEIDGDVRRTNSLFIRLLTEVINGCDLMGKKILEVSCGRGGNVNALCKFYGPDEVVGLDLTESNIAFCAANNRYDRAWYVAGDAERLPFFDDTFDIVLNIESSHLYPNVGDFYQETLRVLKPGGMFLYADVMDEADLIRNMAIMQELGFHMVHCRDITANVLKAGETALTNRMSALQGSFENEQDVLDWLEAPGTQRYEEMQHGKRTFHIWHFAKGELNA